MKRRAVIAFIFLLGWGAFFNTLYSSSKIIFILDSGHYLFTSGLIAENLSKLLNPFAALPAQLGAEIMLDGPILSSLTAMCLLVFRQNAVGTCWPWVAAMLSVLNGISAVCVFLLACKLSGAEKRTGVAMGVALAWCLYPAAVISSGRLLTEQLAVTLLLMITLISTRLADSAGRNLWAGFSCGILSAIGFLLKPALVGFWFLIPLYALVLSTLRHLRPFPRIVTFILGILLIMGPWIDFGYRATGHFCPSPQRVPAHNVAKGQDLTTDGWSSEPCSQQTSLYEEMGSFASIRAAWTSNPLAMADLYLRKIPRTVAFIWNDFRQAVFGLSCDQQNYVQGLLLGLAIFGAAAVILGAAASEFLPVVIGFGALLQPVLYLPFEAITRYGFCASPFLLLLACYGLTRGTSRRVWVFCTVLAAVVSIKAIPLEHLSIDGPSLALIRAAVWGIVLLLCARSLWSHLEPTLRKATFSRKLFLSLLFSLMVFLPAVCVALHRSDFSDELILESGQSLSRKFNLVSPPGAGRSILLLVDFDGPAHFTLNKRPLPYSPVSLNKLDSAYYSLFNLMRIYSAIVDQPVESMRQWRVLLIPKQFLKSGENELTLRSDGHVKVYAERLGTGESSVRLPDRGFSAGLMCNGNIGAEMRLPSLESTGFTRSIFDTQIDGRSVRLHQHLLPRLFLAAVEAESADLETPPPVQFNLPAQSFAAAFRSPSAPNQILRVNKYAFQLAGPAVFERNLPVSVCSWPLMEVSISGKIKAVGRNPKASVMLTLVADGGSPFMTLPACSPAIVCRSNNWNDFEIKDVIPTKMLGGKEGKLIISLFPGCWEQMSQYGCGYGSAPGSFEFRDLKVRLEPSRRPAITGKRLEIF